MRIEDTTNADVITVDKPIMPIHPVYRYAFKYLLYDAPIYLAMKNLI